jgi:hypothetical protein
MFFRAWVVNERYSEIFPVTLPNFCTSSNRLSRNAFFSQSEWTRLPQVSWKFSELSVVMKTSTNQNCNEEIVYPLMHTRLIRWLVWYTKKNQLICLQQETTFHLLISPIQSSNQQDSQATTSQQVPSISLQSSAFLPPAIFQ